MPGPIAIGDEAPNFDLSSTEEALLMLKDEAARTALVVYFFADPGDERALRDLDALNRRRDALAGMTVRILAVSPAPLDGLKKVQRERKLLFPLLHDDRNFSASYGVAAAPALVVVDRRQRIRFIANPVVSVDDAMPQVETALKALPSPTQEYPKSVVNRWIDRWVN